MYDSGVAFLNLRPRAVLSLSAAADAAALFIAPIWFRFLGMRSYPRRASAVPPYRRRRVFNVLLLLYTADYKNLVINRLVEHKDRKQIFDNAERRNTIDVREFPHQTHIAGEKTRKN